MLQAAKIGGDQVVLTFPCNPTGYLVDGNNNKSYLQDLSVYFPNHVSESTTNYYLDLQHVTVSSKIFFKIVTGDKIHFKKRPFFLKV